MYKNNQSSMTGGERFLETRENYYYEEIQRQKAWDLARMPLLEFFVLLVKCGFLNFYLSKLKYNHTISLFPFIPLTPLICLTLLSDSWPFFFNAYMYTTTIYKFVWCCLYVYSFQAYHLVLVNQLGGSSLEKTISPSLSFP